MARYLIIQLCVTYIDVGDVCVLVDVHVGDLVTGVWPQGAVTRLTGAGACAEAGGQEAVILVRGAREAGAAGPPGHQPPRGHGVRPPGSRGGRGRGGAVKIRSHSRLQWVMSEYGGRMGASGELRKNGTRGWNKTGSMSALHSSDLSIPGHVNGIFAPAKTTNCIDDVVLATKYFNDKRIINPSKNLIKLTQTRRHTTWLYNDPQPQNIKQLSIMWNVALTLQKSLGF